jgi:hypothetical protein
MAAIEMVLLRGGIVVPITAIKLLLDLESRGFTVRADGDWLVVNPRGQLTAADDQAIRAHRDELLALVRGCEAIQ